MRPKARTSNLVVQEASGETLIYDLENNKAYCLNATSSLVWKHCDGERDVVEVKEAIGRELNKPIAEEMVWLALDQLKSDDLLESFDEQGSPLEGLSRRQVIRKIGLASVVALPLISSLVAPEASMAQSGLGVLAQCGAGFGTCAPGLSCVGTVTVSVPNIATPNALNQCCAGGSVTGGTFCANACGSVGCDGNTATPAPPDLACTGMGQVTCML